VNNDMTTAEKPPSAAGGPVTRAQFLNRSETD
jgi:hypothetical protein